MSVPRLLIETTKIPNIHNHIARTRVTRKTSGPLTRSPATCIVTVYERGLQHSLSKNTGNYGLYNHLKMSLAGKKWTTARRVTFNRDLNRSPTHRAPHTSSVGSVCIKSFRMLNVGFSLCTRTFGFGRCERSICISSSISSRRAAPRASWVRTYWG